MRLLVYLWEYKGENKQTSYFVFAALSCPSRARCPDGKKPGAWPGLGVNVIRVIESRELIEGFGCRYRRVKRTWLLFGVPVWSLARTARA